MKVCIKCETEKDIDMFGKNNRNIDGFENTCRECRSIKSKEEYIKNKDKISESHKKYYLNNKNIRLEKNKEYYKKNKTKILKAQKNYQNDKSDKIKEYQKEYHKNNINYKEYKLKNSERIREYDKLYRNDPATKKRINKNRGIRNRVRKSEDPLFKLICSIRSVISNNLKCGGFKKSEKTEKILGCKFEDFKLHLESKFEHWMNWENKGLYNGEFNFGWDIDHIIPLSAASTEEDIIRLNHYKNLQPLCSKINREIKSNKLDYEMPI